MIRVNVIANIFGDMAKIIAEEEREMATRMRGAIAAAANDLKAQLRQQVTAAGLGPRLATTWRSEVYPRQGVQTMHPSAVVWTKAPKIIEAHNKGGVIQSPYGRFLAIPTADGLRLMGGRRGSPEDALNKLRRATVGRGDKRRVVIDRGLELAVIPLQRGNRAQAAIVARGATYGRSGAVRRASDRRAALGMGERNDIVLFWLVRQVRLRKSLNVEAAVAEADKRLAGAISMAIARG